MEGKKREERGAVARTLGGDGVVSRTAAGLSSVVSRTVGREADAVLGSGSVWRGQRETAAKGVAEEGRGQQRRAEDAVEEGEAAATHFMG